MAIPSRERGARAGFATLRERLNQPGIFRTLAGLFAATVFAFAVVPVLHALRGQSIKDYVVWYDAGQMALHGGEIYPPPFHKFPFMYPPPCALFLAPLTALGKIGMILVLVVVNAAAWIGGILLSVRLAACSTERAETLLYLVPNMIVVAFVWGNFLLGQPSLLLLALMLASFAALRSGRNCFAGVLIACAAAIKAFPILAIFYLVYRRYWAATAALVLTLAFLFIAMPSVFRGPAQAREDLQRWADGMLFKYDESGFAQRTERSNSWKNQSLWGVANRLLRQVDSDFAYGPHTPVYVNLANLKFATVNAIIVACAILLGLIFINVMPGRFHRTAETDAIEFALLLLLMLMFTPLSFGYTFAWLLYPFTVVVERLLRAKTIALFSFALGATLLLALTIPFRVGAQTYGNVLFATLLLFLGLAIELRSLKKGGRMRIQSSANLATELAAPLHSV